VEPRKEERKKRITDKTSYSNSSCTFTSTISNKVWMDE
jgi:hypothetical protein